MIHLANRLNGIKASASAEISLRVRELRAQGRDIIDLGIGQPDFDTPPHIIEAAHRAGLDGQTRYPPTQGTLALREAVSAKFARENNLAYDVPEIIVSNGAKQVIFNALMATLEPGDEVLLCAPHFDSYASMVRVLGGVPVLLEVQEADGFILQPEVLGIAITERTRWLFLNSPGNPTGAVYGASDYQALLPVLDARPTVQILSDEIYEHIVFDGLKAVSFAAACPELKDRTLTVNGASKAYAMTGFRIGYGGGPAPLMKAMMVVQSQISSGACSIARRPRLPRWARKALLKPRAKHTNGGAICVMAAVETLPGINLRKPGGAFYALLNVSGLGMESDQEVAAFFLEAAGVAGVPGYVYGLSPFFRSPHAAAENKIGEALRAHGSSIREARMNIISNLNRRSTFSISMHSQNILS